MIVYATFLVGPKAEAQTIDMSQFRVLVQLLIAIGAIPAEKADIARMIVGIPVGDATTTPLQSVSNSNVTPTDTPVNNPVVTGVVTGVPQTPAYPTNVDMKIKTSASGNDWNPSSITLQNGQVLNFTVLLFKDGESVRDADLSVVTDDPVGFDKETSSTSGSNPTTTSMVYHGTANVNRLYQALGRLGKNTWEYSVNQMNQKPSIGTHTFTFSVPAWNISKTVTVNVTE